MKSNPLLQKKLPVGAVLSLIALFSAPLIVLGQTEITKWPHDLRGAVSITYDDGSINQFRNAMPLMDRLRIPGTFFINTGHIAGSTFHGRFIGRPVESIIVSTETTPTHKDNFFERASAAPYLGVQEGFDYHNRAGSRFDADYPDEAYQIIDEFYEKVRKGELSTEVQANFLIEESKGLSWDDFRLYASRGHEFASHMVTHPRMAALDEANMIYELEKSREEILNQLGPKHTFSAECPYGTENERVMEYAHKFYPALRNRMPEPFMAELNRSNRSNPGAYQKEYVQWQRGATTRTPLPLMKTWIDTTASNENIWLVLVFHGVDDIGWEALTSELLSEYFRYMRSRDDKLWIATFGDVTKYVRERMNTKVNSQEHEGKILVSLSNSLDIAMYDIPLSLKTYLPEGWKVVRIKQGNKTEHVNSNHDSRGSYVLYQASPAEGVIELSRE